MVSGLAPGGIVTDLGALLDMLNRYSALITPWATSVANAMVSDVNRRNELIWKRVGKQMGREIRNEIATSPQGIVYRDLMAENVDLIKSIPLKAGERVQKLTTEALSTGRRAESIAREIQNTTRVSKSRARLIARTEVARTSALFTQARAMQVGSEGYIWRTSEDSDVRETHKAQNGKYIRWDKPPKTDKDLDPYHAGCGPNCRCYPEPVFPEL
jgi:SPP1 gp7 family putative phage head morphogenesis protein